MNDTRKRRPTLQDIADLTGVTKMTVSRYLRDPSAVAEGTSERIAAAVEELGYIPNRAPDMLSNATSKAIGILIPSLSNQVFSAVIHGIESVTRPAGRFSRFSVSQLNATANTMPSPRMSSQSIAAQLFTSPSCNASSRAARSKTAE